MANEATIVELTNSTGFPRRYTCADGTAITKGSLLRLTDPRTASAQTVYGEVMAGIAMMDKEASDGSTSISCYTDGVFEMVASGGITIGNPVTGATANKVEIIKNIATASGAMILGYALETASDGETINVRVKL